MMRCWLMVSVLAVGCGSDGASTSCAITFGSDVSGTDSCQVFLCYPTDSTYQSLLVAMSSSSTIGYQLAAEVDAPTVFEENKSYGLADLRSQSDLHVTANGKTYKARAGAVTRDPAETGTVAIHTLTAPSGGDACNGTVTGTMTLDMVEMIANGSTETVGPGRVHVDVTIGH